MDKKLSHIFKLSQFFKFYTPGKMLQTQATNASAEHNQTQNASIKPPMEKVKQRG